MGTIEVIALIFAISMTVVCLLIAEKKEEKEASQNNDKYLGLKVVCFLFPIVGLIVYAVNIVQNPEIAKTCGQWALIGFIIGFILIGSIIALQFS